MVRTRVIPCLLLKGRGLVKTVKFDNPRYVGDPINAVRIFNEKEVDELMFLDIEATADDREPHYDIISQLASECFMPLSYGGGLRNIDQIKKILRLGVEKVVLNSSAVSTPEFIRDASNVVGNQSVVVSIDFKRNLMGRYVMYTHGGRKKVHLDPLSHAMTMEKMGAGELLLNSIDRDGTMRGYDIGFIKKISDKVDIPVIACGGAGSLFHLSEAVNGGGASAVSAGSMFVFHGKHRAVLINFPTQEELRIHLP